MQGSQDSSSAQHFLESLGKPIDDLKLDPRGETIVAAFQLEGDDLIAFRDALNECIEASEVEYEED